MFYPFSLFQSFIIIHFLVYKMGRLCQIENIARRKEGILQFFRNCLHLDEHILYALR